MELELRSGIVEEVTKSDILELASWDRPRSSEELRNRVTSRLAELALIEDES